MNVLSCNCVKRGCDVFSEWCCPLSMRTFLHYATTTLLRTEMKTDKCPAPRTGIKQKKCSGDCMCHLTFHAWHQVMHESSVSTTCLGVSKNIECISAGLTVWKLRDAKWVREQLVALWAENMSGKCVLSSWSLKAASRSPRGHALFEHCDVSRILRVLYSLCLSQNASVLWDAEGAFISLFCCLASLDARACGGFWMS